MALDLQTLKFTVDTKDLDTAKTKIDALVTSVQSLAKPVESLGKAADKASKATKDVADGAEQSAGKVRKLSKDIGDTTNPVEALQSKLKNTFKDLAEGFTRGESSVLNLARSLKASESDLDSIKAVLGDIGKLLKDPFDSAIGSVRSVTKELDLMQQRANLAGQGILLTTKQLKEYGRIADEVAGKMKSQGIDVTQGSGKTNFDVTVAAEQQKYLNTAQAVNSLTQAEKTRQLALKETAKIEQANIGVGDQMVAQYRKRQNAIQGEIDKLKEQAAALKASSSVTTGNLGFRLTNLGASPAQLAEAKALRKEIEDLGKAARTSETPLKGFASALRQLIPTLGALTTGAIVARLGDEFVKAADALTVFEARLNFLSKGTVNFNDAFGRLIDISNEARTSVDSTSTFFSRLVPVMASVGKSTNDAYLVTESFSKLLLVSGTSTREASTAMYQFSQALGKGKLDGDEFRTMAESTPELLRLLEKQLGVTRAELYKMSEQGKLTSDVLIDTLGSALPQLQKAAADMPKTVEGSIVILQNTAKEVVNTINQATGLTQALAGIIDQFAGFMKIISDNGPATIAVMGALTGAAVAGGLVAAARGMSMLAVSTGALGIAMNLLALNPVMLAILAGGALIGGLAAFSKSTEKTFEGLSRKAEGLRYQLDQIKADPDPSKNSMSRYAIMEKELQRVNAELALFNKASYSNEELREKSRQTEINASKAQQDGLANARRELSGFKGDYNKFIGEIEAANKLLEAGLTGSEHSSMVKKIYEKYGILDKEKKSMTGGKSAEETAEQKRLASIIKALGTYGDVLNINNGYLSDYNEKEADLNLLRQGGYISQQQLNESMEALKNKQPFMIEKLKEQAEALKRSAEYAKAYAAELDKVRDVIAERSTQVKERGASIAQSTATFGMTDSQAELYNAQLEIRKQLEKDINEIMSSDAVTVNDVKELEKLAEENLLLAEQEILLKKNQEAGAKFADIFTSAFAGLLDGTKKWKDAMGDLKDAVYNLIVQLLVLEPLKASLQGFFGAAIPAVTSFFGGMFANGGTPPLNKVSVVGERGPELFVPKTMGTIIPNNQLGGGSSSSGDTQIVINNYSGQAVETTEAVDSRGNRRIEVTVGEMVSAETGRTGSSTQKAIGGTFGLKPSLIRR